jgi:hypothetical protein
VPSSKRRIYELDLLRGLFIVIIVIDHLQFWPSPLTYLTGEGRLWVSAAEGFFLISGLLIGYIRAYKNRGVPLGIITKKLLHRAAMLYVWGVGITLVLVWFTLSVPQNPLLPTLPDATQLSSLPSLLWSIISMDYVSGWIYFLRLYAIMLAVTPLFLWMLRRQYERVIVIFMAGAYCVSWVYPEGGLQWQVLFFGAALIGYHLETIAQWFAERPAVKRLFLGSLIAISALTMVLSYYFVHSSDTVIRLIGQAAYDGVRQTTDLWFSSNPLAFGRILLAFLWFGGLLALFHICKGFLMRRLKWLLLPLGEHSLSVYCLQALLLPLIVVCIPIQNYWTNGTIAVVTVLFCWAVIKYKPLSQFLPR